MIGRRCSHRTFSVRVRLGESPTQQLGPKDHTSIMRAFMERPLPVVRQLASARREGRKPTGDEVLEAMAQVSDLPQRTRQAIDTAIRVRRDLAEAKPLSRAASGALTEINKRIEASRGLDDLLCDLAVDGTFR